MLESIYVILDKDLPNITNQTTLAGISEQWWRDINEKNDKGHP
nr:hypothetical protein [Providencia stuartii]